MCGGLGLVPGARNAWSYWIDHILKQRERFGFVAATMITTRGAVSAFTKDFVPTAAEVEVMISVVVGRAASFCFGMFLCYGQEKLDSPGPSGGLYMSVVGRV